MSMNSKKRIIITAALVIFLGIASFGLLGLLISFGGAEFRPATFPNEPGFQSAMIWFELAASKQEIFQILGDPDDQTGIHIRKVMDKMNIYDYVYMVSYSLLCVFISALVFYLNQNKQDFANAKTFIFHFCVFVSILMFAGDAMENAQLLKLTKYSRVADIDNAVITALNIWTRVKWGSIFIFAAGMVYQYFLYFKGKKIPQALFVIAYGSSAVLGIISLSIPSARYLVEPASYCIALSWLVSIVHAGITLKSNIAAE